MHCSGNAWQAGNRLRHGCREHQRAAVFRRFAQDKFEVFAKAHVEHFIGFVEHDRAQLRHIERIARNVVAQAARRADDDMASPLQRAALGTDIHATNAGCNPRAGIGIKPFQFTAHLKCKFARRRDNHGKWRTRITEAQFVFENGVGHGKAKSHRLARPRLGRHKKIGSECFGGQNSILNSGKRIVTASG